MRKVTILPYHPVTPSRTITNASQSQSVVRLDWDVTPSKFSKPACMTYPFTFLDKQMIQNCEPIREEKRCWDRQFRFWNIWWAFTQKGCTISSFRTACDTIFGIAIIAPGYYQNTFLPSWFISPHLLRYEIHSPVRNDLHRPRRPQLGPLRHLNPDFSHNYLRNQYQRTFY